MIEESKKRNIDIMYSTYQTSEEQLNKIKAKYGEDIANQIFLNHTNTYWINDKFAKKCKNSQYHMIEGKDGRSEVFVLSVSQKLKSEATKTMSGILEELKLQEKFDSIGGTFVSKDLLLCPENAPEELNLPKGYTLASDEKEL